MAVAKELIIPDIHLNWPVADRIIERENPDRIWLLGDYFDDFGDTLGQTEQTCQWLIRTFQDPRILRIIGNHDVYYFCENRSCRGAGYTRDKHDLIRQYFSKRAVRENFVLHGRTNGYLLSHAGFTAHWLARYPLPLLDRYLTEAFEAMLRDEVHPLLDAGEDRGGPNAYGGVTWCDWYNFKQIPGVPQIAGHTCAPEVRWAGFEEDASGNLNFERCVAGSIDPGEEPVYSLRDEVSLCLDTALRHYAILDDSGNVQVKRTPQQPT